MGKTGNFFGRFFGRQWNISAGIKAAISDIRSRILVPRAPSIEASGPTLARYAKKSELVYACINKKAQAATDPELVVQRRNAKGDYETVPGHPAAALVNHPNPYDTGESFIRCWIASENVSGVFYSEIVKSKSGQPVQLYPLIPTNMTPRYRETEKGSVIDFYSYFINGREIKFAPEELMIRYRDSLASVLSVSSPLSVALNTVDADIAAVEYVRAFFNNGGTPSGVINIKGRKLSEEEMLQYQQRWVQKFSRGGSNRGGPAILDSSEVEYTPLGTKLNELNSEALTSIDESRICMVFGVPPILIGAYVGLLHVNQRASVREAQQDFWMNTMSPELKSIRKFLDHSLLPMFEDADAVRGGEFRFNWDMSQVDALQEEQSEAHKRVGQAYKDGIYKLNEARAALMLDPDPERGEEYYKAPPTFGTNGDQPKTIIEISDGHPAKLLLPGPEEKKTLDFSRKLTELEETIDVKKIADDQETEAEKLFNILITLRDALIASAVETYTELSDADISQLILSPPADVYKKIRRILISAFQNGQFQIIDELIKQGADIENAINDALEAILEGIDRVTDLTVANVVSEVQARAVDQIVSFGVLGIAATQIPKLLRDALDEQSDAWVEGYAGAAVNASMQRGRDYEMEAQDKHTRIYVYSGILDRSICKPCKRWDGEKREKRSDLPRTPNPKCKGRERCRCFVIAVYGGDDFKPEENEVR